MDQNTHYKSMFHPSVDNGWGRGGALNVSPILQNLFPHCNSLTTFCFYITCSDLKLINLYQYVIINYKISLKMKFFNYASPSEYLNSKDKLLH